MVTAGTDLCNFYQRRAAVMTGNIPILATVSMMWYEVRLFMENRL
jgi:hypothetical protein